MGFLTESLCIAESLAHPVCESNLHSVQTGYNEIIQKIQTHKKETFRSGEQSAQTAFLGKRLF